MHHQRRQSNTEPPSVPSVSGISNGAVTVGTAPETNTLVFDSTITRVPQETAPPLAATTSTILSSPPSSAAQSSTADASSSSKSSAAVEPLPISTVIGACVATFVGAAVVILAGWWLYKRSSPKSKRKTRSRNNHAPLIHNRNFRGEYDRSKSGTENWARLEEAGSKWEDEYQTRERPVFGTSEKLNMREKVSSFRSVGRPSTDQRLSFDTSPYSTYHPSLAQELAGAQTPQYLANVDTGPPITWGDKLTPAEDPFVAIRNSRLTASAVSPSKNAAIPTPQAVAIEPHQWESAEVMDYEAELASSRSPKNSIDHERQTRHKGRNRTQDPFADQFAVSKPVLPALHVPASSDASNTSSRERALQSLIAALDITPEQVEERLHVASMKTPTRSPSSIHASNYIYEEDVAS